MPDRPLTILQLTHQGGGPGPTTIIADLSRQLARRGHRVLVGCRPDTKLAGLARDAGLGLVPLDFGRLAPLAHALEGVTDREGVDVVNSNATRDRRALTWLRWTRRLSRPFVVTRHTMPLTSPAELVAVGLSADRTIAVSQAVARALRRRLHPGGRIRVVTNGIDLAHRGALHRPPRVHVARTAGRRVGCRRQSRPDHVRRHGSPGAAARPDGMGASPDPRTRRWGVCRADRAAGPRARPAGVHARAHRRADRGGGPGSARATEIARRRSRIGALSTTLLLALNFPPFGGGIARMMGDPALPYPPRGLTISTATWPAR